MAKTPLRGTPPPAVAQERAIDGPAVEPLILPSIEEPEAELPTVWLWRMDLRAQQLAG
jgi:hypothetical protein